MKLSHVEQPLTVQWASRRPQPYICSVHYNSRDYYFTGHETR